MRRRYIFTSRQDAENGYTEERRRTDLLTSALHCAMHEEPCWKGRESMGRGDSAYYTAKLYRPLGNEGGIFLLTWNVPSTGQKPMTTPYRLDDAREVYHKLNPVYPQIQDLLYQALQARQREWDARDAREKKPLNLPDSGEKLLFALAVELEAAQRIE